MTQSSNKYNLEDRTAKFGEKVIQFCKNIEQSVISRPIISQLIRSATSIGANYMEANGASSKKDFMNKIFICKKEAQETKHWLRMLATCSPEHKEQIRQLWKESQELTLIFQSITSSSKKPNTAKLGVED
ncbi:MAG: four helix bundle protein [bacterium]|nr:four helix bundle protein [bacterium]